MRRNPKRRRAGRRGARPAGRHPPARSGLHYAWIVLAVCFVSLLTAAAVRSVPGIILTSLEAEFGWSRTSIAAAVSANLLLFGLAGPFLGRLMDLYGPRRVALATLVLVAAGCGGTVWMTEPWQMIALWGGVVGAGSGGTSMLLGTAVVNRWFIAHRGLALGILGAAMSAGQLIFTPVLMRFNLEYGWRAAAEFATLGIAGLALPLVWLGLKDHPASLGLRALGAPKRGSAPVEAEPVPESKPMEAVLRHPTFWILAVSFGICGLTTSGLFQTHLIPHGVEHGFPESTMAWSLGVMGAADIVGTIGSGWICDRFGARIPLAIYYLLRGASLLVLPLIDSTVALMAFSILYGLNWLSTVPATATLAADTFGRRNIGVVFGWIFFAHQAGAAIAATSVSYFRALMGDYALAFTLAGLLALLAGGLVLGRPSREERVT